jgi:ATP-dependent DNA ligase
MEFPILYTTDSKDKERTWRCWVEEDTVFREHGLTEGKKVQSERTFEGKNIGKKNEISAEQQALIEAEKEWINNVDKKGYLPSNNDKKGQEMLKKIQKGKQENNTNINASELKVKKNITRKKEDTEIVEDVEGLIPQKCQVWEVDNNHNVLPKVAKYFKDEFYVQPKLDGWRAAVRAQNNNVIITSNSGKQYPFFASLRQLFSEWFKHINLNGLALDGELYCLNMDPLVRFSTVCSICGLARSQPHELEDLIQFHCFDVVDQSETLTQKQRFKQLDIFFEKLPESCKSRIIRVKTDIIKMEDVKKYHDEYVQEGFEGIVLRTFNNLYKCGKRNIELRKFKMFEDAEYEIVGTQLDKGVPCENFVWTLRTEDDQQFNAKPTGTISQRLYWYEHRKEYVRCFMTIKFQELSKDGVPRFGIAKNFRTGKSVD